MNKTRVLKAITALLLVLTLMPAVVPACAEEATVTVRNYDELVKAFDSDATRILISTRYNHGKGPDNANIPSSFPTIRNKEITIAPENGESAVIRGRLNIGMGKVTFENVTIEAPNDSVGLYVGGGTVIIDSVRGGSSRKGDGCPAVIVRKGTVKIGNAIGGDSQSGLGGEGIVALEKSTVEVGDAVGGNGGTGVGGAAILAERNTKVLVSGTAKGGDGKTAPGKGVVAAKMNCVEVRGTSEDGQLLESKKTFDPDVIVSHALLVNAIRSGKTEICISTRYIHIEPAKREGIPLIVPEGAAVRIVPEAKDGRLQKLSEAFCIVNGKWEFAGFDMSLLTTPYVPLDIGGDAVVSFTGNITTAKADAVSLSGDAQLNLQGSITVNGDRTNALRIAPYSGATVSVTGDITVKGNGCAIMAQGGTVEVTGDISKTKPGDYVTVYACYDSSVTLTGNVTALNSNALFCKSGSVIRMNGDVSVRQKKYHPVVAEGGTIYMNGKISAPMEQRVLKGGMIYSGEAPAAEDGGETAGESENSEEAGITETAASDGNAEETGAAETVPQDGNTGEPASVTVHLPKIDKTRSVLSWDKTLLLDNELVTVWLVGAHLHDGQPEFLICDTEYKDPGVTVYVYDGKANGIPSGLITAMEGVTIPGRAFFREDTAMTEETESLSFVLQAVSEGDIAAESSPCIRLVFDE